MAITRKTQFPSLLRAMKSLPFLFQENIHNIQQKRLPTLLHCLFLFDIFQWDIFPQKIMKEKFSFEALEAVPGRDKMLPFPSGDSIEETNRDLNSIAATKHHRGSIVVCFLGADTTGADPGFWSGGTAEF